MNNDFDIQFIRKIVEGIYREVYLPSECRWHRTLHIGIIGIIIFIYCWLIVQERRAIGIDITTVDNLIFCRLHSAPLCCKAQRFDSTVIPILAQEFRPAGRQIGIFQKGDRVAVIANRVHHFLSHEGGGDFILGIDWRKETAGDESKQRLKRHDQYKNSNQCFKDSESFLRICILFWKRKFHIILQCAGWP